MKVLMRKRKSVWQVRKREEGRETVEGEEKKNMNKVDK